MAGLFLYSCDLLAFVQLHPAGLYYTGRRRWSRELHLSPHSYVAFKRTHFQASVYLPAHCHPGKKGPNTRPFCLIQPERILRCFGPIVSNNQVVAVVEHRIKHSKQTFEIDFTVSHLKCAAESIPFFFFAEINNFLAACGRIQRNVWEEVCACCNQARHGKILVNLM